MGFDPFYTSKESLETSIVDLEQTVADYRRLQNHDTSTAQWQLGMIEHRYNEAIQLKNLLDQSCKKAAEDPARFGITPEELRSRQAYIERAAQRLKMVHQQMDQSKPKETATKGGITMTREERIRRAGEERNAQFIDREMQNQQAMIQRQDQDLDDVGEQVQKIKMVAGMIGDELHDATQREAEIGNHMDRTQTKIDDTVAKMKEFLKKKSTWLWIGCAILTVILLVMIVWAFFI